MHIHWQRGRINAKLKELSPIQYRTKSFH
ncbi:TPA: IS3 family transposase [Streptococcus suis]